MIFLKYSAKKYKYLQDVNIDTYLFITDALQLNTSFSKTTTYDVTPNIADYRNLALAKKGIEVQVDTYIQMFDDKHGFIPNLSILDLLFMEGPNALSYL